MKALFIQHDHVSPVGPVGERLEMHGFEIETFEVVTEANYRNPNITVDFPDVNDYDLLIPLGAPWGAWDDACIGNWLSPELAWIASAVKSGKPVLGICFGGQLLARALGGSVAKGPKPELGWTYVFSDQPDLVGNGPWFQFHYDRWTLPPGAREIARTPAASQAFVYNKALALQFHPELNLGTLEQWMVWDGREEVTQDGQDPDVMLAQTRSEDPAARLRTFELVDSYLSKVAGLI
ncbi:gamma-glutamyl-gamma-aminobutyrate hydrolase family protein [Aquiluna borgnonia]|uniref:Gamma-glutamyl-gamma-aminobutyrate hydrolase family protein n=1 Tax=Aquiluna borgnonia TaxID=2499157 RepID=A0A7D4UIJ8_9MICO|nr:gamma-glutamyl-gamma-aminobutyrate hydrolase family protein [Aquiluna borgnonia]QKJ25620.1 gamma-glutamyl-gamma-aminobutyrate hydrolase family protein [Aquiluna borgnonia]